MIKAVIFDLDNTLIDFWKFKTRSVNAALNAMIKAGLRMKKSEAEKIIIKTYSQHGMEYQYIFQRLFTDKGRKVDYRILAHGLIAYRKTRGNLLVSYKGVKKVLELLKKSYRLAIISDAPRIKAWLRLVSIDIENYFETVITFDDTKKRKPNALPFKSALKKMRISGKEAVMVGDNIKRDIIGAKRLGMRTVFARYGGSKTLGENNADEQIDSINELPSAIERIEKKA